MKIHDFRLSKFSLILVFFLMLLLPTGCNENNSDSTGAQSPDTGPAADAGTASAAVKVNWHPTAGQKQSSAPIKTAHLDCEAAQVANVVVKVYDEANSHLVTAGPWPCDSDGRKVDRIPEGQNRRFVILATDNAGNVRFNGQTGNIAIIAGETTPERVEVDAYPFATALTAPQTGSMVDSNTVSLSWTPVDNAEAYQVQLAETADFQTDIVNQRTPATEFASTNLEPGKTYYWKISAVDAYENVGIVSEVRTFTTLDRPIISGTLSNANGDGITGVTVTFTTSDGRTATVATDSSGTYRRAVSEGWSGTVTPSSDRYEFDPPSERFDNVRENIVQNFTGKAVTPIISGRILAASTRDQGIGGITIEFTDGGGSATTGDDGTYSMAVPYDWTGSATPADQGYAFDQPSIAYENVISNQENQNFIVTGVEISGSINHNNAQGAPFEGVTLAFGANLTTTTNADGYYRIDVPYDWSGMTSPDLKGYTFDPAFLEFPNVTRRYPNQNFTASRLPVVSVVTTQPIAEEATGPGRPPLRGQYEISRTGNTDTALIINFTMFSSTATANEDYTLLCDSRNADITFAPSVMIPENQEKITISVIALDDTVPYENGEQAIFGIIDHSTYEVGENHAIVSIGSDE